MKKSVGKASYDLLTKKGESYDVVEMQREMQKSASVMLEDIIKKHKSYADEYYIEYMIQKDRLLPNVLRQRFFVRKTKPSADYDTSLFSYNNKSHEFLFHWCIPDEETCLYLLNHEGSLSTEEKELLKYVHDFSDLKLV